MNGIINSASKFALLGGTAVGLALSSTVPASAASMVDRGIERRVSDLEAEVRLLKNRVKALEDRKLAVPDKIVVSGNSRVKVTLYGQVNRAVAFNFSKNDGSVHHVDNSGSSSRLGILARGRLFPDVTVSALFELEWTNNRRDATNDTNDGLSRVRSRVTDIWFTHADLGSLYLGHGSTASDAAGLFTLSGTSMVFGFHGGLDDGTVYNFTGQTAPAQTGGLSGAGVFGHGWTTGRRQNRIMYVSPRIAGFQFRASHGENDEINAAVRYAGSPFGMKDIRVLGAFGYAYAPTGGSTVPGNPGGFNAFAASGGILHVPTGLSINGSWTRVVQLGTNFPGQMNPNSWALEAGWQGRIWAMGNSYWSVGYGNWNGGGVTFGRAVPVANDRHLWRIHTAFVQAIDSAATDIYAGYAYSDAKAQGAAMDANHVIIVGARIKF